MTKMVTQSVSISYRQTNKKNMALLSCWKEKNEIDVQYESIKKIEIYEYTVYKFKKNKIDEIDDYAYL